MVRYCLFSLIFICSFSLSAQAFPDRHSTSYVDAWVSCQTSPSPITDNPAGHWILYDLGSTYRLGTSTMWNYNDPAHLDRGIQEFTIDISPDGANWTHMGSYTMAMASGSAFYQGETGPHLGEAEARFVLITAVSNYGASCYGLSEVRIDVDGAPLPVEFQDFSVDCQGSSVKIEWSTLSELNNSHFEIQRSKDGSIWVSLDKVDGNPNSQSLITYEYIDKYPEAYAHYRLRQQDLDGKATYHEIVSVECGDELVQLKASPNPFMENTSVRLSGVKEGPLRYTLSDVSGKVWKEEEIDYREGHPLDLDLSDLSNGQYIIRINIGATILQQQLIKIDK